MPTLLRYFIGGANADLLDLRVPFSGYEVTGQSVTPTGSATVNTVRAALGVELDARNLLGGEDVIVFSYNWSQYTKSLTEVSGAIVFSYTDSGTGLTEKVTVSNGALSAGRDKLVFADGAMLTNNARTALTGDLAVSLPAVIGNDPGTNTGNYALPVPAGNTMRVFASTTNTGAAPGATFALGEAGQTAILTGTALADSIYVKAGAVVDARNLLGGEDKIYLTGNWADYSKSLTAVSGAIQFTRVINGFTETVTVSNGALSAGRDKLVFADGAVLTQNARAALITSLSVPIDQVLGYDALTTSPGLAPTQAAAVGGLADDVGAIVGNVAAGGVTDDTSLTLSGTLSAAIGATDTVRIYDGATLLGTAVVTGTSWSYVDTRTLADGQALSYTARVANAAGSPGPVGAAYAITVDTTAPAAAAAAPMAAAGPLINTAEATAGVAVLASLAGTGAVAGDLIELRLDGVSFAVPVTRVLTAGDITAGVYTFTVNAAALGVDGVKALTSVVIDAAGNVGAASAALSLTLDATAPASAAAPMAAAGPLIDNAEAAAGVSVLASLGGTGAVEGDLLELKLDGASFAVPLKRVLTADDITAGGYTFTVEPGILGANGLKVLTSVVTDVAGNVGAASAVLELALDAGNTIAPVAAAGPIISNTEATAGVAVQTSLTGTNALEGYTIELKLNGASFAVPLTRVLTADDITAGSYTFTVDAAALGSDGVKSLTSVVTDNGGVVGDISPSLRLTLDTSAPSAALAPTAAAGPAISEAETIAGVSVVVSLAGTGAMAGDSLELKQDGASFATPLTRTLTAGDISGGSYTFTVAAGTLGANGPKALTSVVTDVAGNVGAVSAALNLTLDAGAPIAPVAAVPGAFINNAQASAGVSVLVSLTGAGAVVGDSIELKLGGVSLATPLTRTLTAGDITAGTYTFTVGAAALGADGIKTFTSVVTYVDGSAQLISPPLSLTLDASAPAQTVGNVSFSADTGTSQTDLITNAAAQTITGTLSAALATNDLLFGSTDGGASYVDITAKVTGTAIVWDGATLGASGSLKFKVSDQAGNADSITTVGYTLDATAPTLTVNSLSFSADTGASATDFVTTTAAQNITGSLSTNTSAGDVIQVSLDGGATWQAALSAVGTATFSLPGQTLLAGANTLLIRVSDAAGNIGPVTTQAYNLDVTSPVLSVVFSSDTGSSATDLVTRTASQIISGTLRVPTQSGQVVKVSLDNGANWQTASNTLGSTAFSLTGQTLTLGSNQLLIRVDTNGTPGPVSTQTYTLDTTAPTLGLAGGGSLSFSSDIGTSTTDLITSVALQNISGTLDGPTAAGDVVQVSFDLGGTWNTASNAQNSTAFTALNQTLAVGSNAVMLVRVVDAAGNAGSAASRFYTLDTTAPTQTVTAVSFSTDTGTSATDFITKTAVQAINGTLSAATATGDVVKVSLDNGTTWQTATHTAGSTTFSLADRTITGSNTLRVRVEDVAGNGGTAYTQAYTLDTAAPSQLVSNVSFSTDTGSSQTDLITRTASQTIRGTLSAALAPNDVLFGSTNGGASYVDITAKVTGTAIVWDGATLGASGSLRFKVGDKAGNTDSITTVGYTLDTSAPTTRVSGMALSADAGASSTDFITSIAAQTINGTLNANTVAGEVVRVTMDGGVTWQTAINAVGTSTFSLPGQTLTVYDGSTFNQIVARLEDAAGNSSQVFLQSYTLNVTPATISGIAITGASGLVGNTLNTGDVVNVSVSMSENTTVTGIPQLALRIGGSTVYANYVSGSGTTDLLFSYTILADQSDLDGISIPANALSLNSGANLATLKNLAGVNSVLTSEEVASSAAYLVDAVAPTVTGVAITAATGVVNNVLSQGDVVYVTVSMSDPTTVTGAPRLALNIGGSLVQASYASGSGTTALVFSYTIPGGQTDVNGISLAADALSLNGGALRDAAGNNAVLTHAPVADNAAYQVNSVGSAVAFVLATNSVGKVGNVLSIGDTVQVTVFMDQSTTVTGVPQLALNIGGTSVLASYASGSGTTALVFSYTILEGQADADGISVPANALSLNGGTLKDAAGNDSVLTHGAVSDNGAYLVDAVAPTLHASTAPLTALSTIAGTAGNSQGETITLTLTFAEAVNGLTSGTDSTIFKVAGTGVSAIWGGTAGASTRTLTYTVAAGQNGAATIDEAALKTALTAGISDLAGNAFSYTANGGVIANIDTTALPTIDTTAPTLHATTVPVTAIGTAIAGTAGDSAGETITLTVTFDGAVNGLTSGTDSTVFKVAGTGVSASWGGTAGTSTRTLTYTVAPGQNGLATIDEAALKAALIAGISDQAGNAFSYTANGGVIANIDTAALPTIDTTGPAAPSLALGTGVADGATNAEAMQGSGVVTVSGEIGASIVVTFSRSGGGSVVKTVTGTGSPQAVALTGPDISTLGFGTISVQAVATDTAGNTGLASASTSFTLNAQVDLSAVAVGTGGFVINGESAFDFSGYSVSGAGDVNGDGLSDLIVGAYGVNNSTQNEAGKAYVVFGKSGVTAVNLSAVAAGTGGFVMTGASDWGPDKTGWSVSSAGDVNGDGLADMIVGSPAADTGKGRSYVVFGKTNTAGITLSSIDSGISGGFVIRGESANDFSGYSVSGAGDVNGDGLSDLIVGAYGVNNSTQNEAGKAYVVFGKSGVTAVNLSAVAAGTGGFVMTGVSDWGPDQIGWSVKSAGDVNGDGLADMIVGAPASEGSKGRSYVVFGKTSTAGITLSSIDSGISDGFVIRGQSALDNSGYSVSGAGDVNGDGLADLIVGSNLADPVTGGTSAGRSYVVFGKTGATSIELSAVAAGTGGFVINGQSANDQSGVSVSAAGDVNGDGLADLIVGANLSDPASGANAGRSYVVFGKTAGTAIELSAVAEGTGGFVINGQGAADNSGYSVSAAGDVNGDGLADLIVGAGSSDPVSGTDAGRSYVIFGATAGMGVLTAVDQTGTTGNDSLTSAGSQTLVGDAGNDTLTANGADVLYGGSGNDVFVVGATTVTALQNQVNAGGNTSQLARIDGGSGIDTIRLMGGNLDLALVANQSAGSSRINSVERIDLATDAAANTLKVDLKDVLDMAGMNLFNTGNGWSGTPLSATVQRYQLVVEGASGDIVNVVGGSSWTNAGTATETSTGQVYNVWNHNTSMAQMLVDFEMTRNAVL